MRFQFRSASAIIYLSIFLTFDQQVLAVSKPLMCSNILGEAKVSLSELSDLHTKQKLASTQVSSQINPALRDLVVKGLPEEVKPAWEDNQFSDPRLLNASDYLYRVVAVKEQQILNKNIPNGMKSFLDSSFIDSSEILSFSIIDSRKNATWGMAGFIVSVPPENIISMNGHDMLTGRLKWDITLEQKQARIDETQGKGRQAVMPRQLLDLTTTEYGYKWYNEIAAFTKGKTNTRISVEGIFIKVDSLGQPLIGDKFKSQLLEVASSRKIPVIHIPPPIGFKAIGAEVISNQIIKLNCTKDELEKLLVSGYSVMAVELLAAEIGPIRLIEIQDMEGIQRFPRDDGQTKYTLQFLLK